jgi:ABC-type transporter Mla subunit MlaD
MWATLFAVAGGAQYLRHTRRHLAPAPADVRHKTTVVWVPKLYPTVAQRAAQWAIHTLRNAARVTDASEVIERHAVKFVTSVEAAKQAADTFAEGMRQFSEGMESSDHALEKAQAALGNEVQKFADAVARWASFENEITRFYSAMDRHQQQIANEHRGFEALLSGYHGFVSQSSDTLQTAAAEITSAAKSLPDAFQNSAETMARSTAESRAYLRDAIDDLANALRKVQQEESDRVLTSLQAMLQPVLTMEERLRTLSTPFDQAAKNLLEIAQNIWRLNDSFSTEMRSFMATRAAKAGMET